MQSGGQGEHQYMRRSQLLFGAAERDTDGEDVHAGVDRSTVYVWIYIKRDFVLSPQVAMWRRKIAYDIAEFVRVEDHLNTPRRQAISVRCEF